MDADFPLSVCIPLTRVYPRRLDSAALGPLEVLVDILHVRHWLGGRHVQDRLHHIDRLVIAAS